MYFAIREVSSKLYVGDNSEYAYSYYKVAKDSLSWLLPALFPSREEAEKHMDYVHNADDSGLEVVEISLLVKE